jgi:Tfp pilus assembly protein PilX
MPASSRPCPRGFILPTTLLVVVLLTVMLAAAFALITAETRVTDNAFASSRSLAFAQAGMQNYLSVGHNLSGTSDSAIYTFRGGYARVLALRLRDSVTVAPKSRPLWVVRSIGFDTVRAPAGQPNGQRAVAQFARLQTADIPILAAITAANGVQMIGSDGNPHAADPNPISNVDAHFSVVPGCAAIRPNPSSVSTAVLVPAALYLPGSGAAPTGPVVQVGSSAAVIDSTRIDWALLLGGQFTPDYVNQLPSSGNSTYQIHYFTGDVSIPSGSRRGFLVAVGDVSLQSGAHWDGIIVAGGLLDANVNNYTIHGMVVTGLNLSITGQPVQPNKIKRGSNRVLQWEWCYAHASISSLAYLVPIKNAWVDTWSTY